MHDEQKHLTLQIKNYEAHNYLSKMVSVTNWITSIVQQPVEVHSWKAFAEWLRDGVVLCELVNNLKPNTIKDYHSDHSTSSKTKALENILCFLHSLILFNIPWDHRFGPLDLFEEKNLNKVVECLEELAIKGGFDIEKFSNLDSAFMKIAINPQNLKKTIKMLIENEKVKPSKQLCKSPSSREDLLLMKEKAEKELQRSWGEDASLLEMDELTVKNLLPLLDENPDQLDEDPNEDYEHYHPPPAAAANPPAITLTQSDENVGTSDDAENNATGSNANKNDNMQDFMNFLYGGKSTTATPTTPPPPAHLPAESSVSLPVCSTPSPSSPQNPSRSSFSNVTPKLAPPRHIENSGRLARSSTTGQKLSAMRPSISTPKAGGILPETTNSDQEEDHTRSTPEIHIQTGVDPEIEAFLLARSDVSVNFSRMNPKKIQRAKDGFTADMIIAGLYLGDKKAAYNMNALQERNITHVLSMIGDAPFESKFEYLLQTIDDAVDQSIVHLFPAANAFINQARERGGVLVHCHKGVSRSATIVIAYLMSTFKMSFYDASDFVCHKRAIVCPNLGFIEQLKQFETQILKQPSLSSVSPRSSTQITSSSRGLASSSYHADSTEKSRFSALKQLIHGPKSKKEKKNQAL